MYMKKLLMIINPSAGKGSIGNSLFSAVKIFTEQGYRVEVYPTQSEGDATNFIKKHGEKFHRVVCCGGDGTINEVVAGLCTLQKRPILGVIPSGTTNDFSHTLGMPNQPLQAAKAICEGTVSPCDIGRLNGRPFIYAAAFGLFTTLTFSTPQQNKQLFGVAAYVFEALKDLQHLKDVHVTLEYDGGVIEGDYLICMITNTISIAGFRRMFENVTELDDGKFEVTLIKRPSNVNDIQKLINILVSLEPVDNNVDFITFIESSRISVKTDKLIDWTVDGQNAGQNDNATIEVVKHAIEIVK